MPFTHGTVSARRFTTSVMDAPKQSFDEGDIESLAHGSADRCPLSDDEPQHGWCGGLHELDMEFSCEKNLRGDFLSFAWRVTEERLPQGRIKALAELEILGAVKDGRVMAWAEAKETATATVEEEGKDGRYKRHTVVPVVWDAKSGQVWFGTGGTKHTALFQQDFADTFGVELTPITAGSWVTDQDSRREMAWIEEGSDDWLGNECLMWLLARDHAGKGDERIGDLTVMVSKTCQMACPNGTGGKDVFSLERPVAMPELNLAAREGKVARRAGLTVVDGAGVMFELTLQAEEWVVTGAKLPESEDYQRDRAVAELERLEQCRSLFWTIDQILAAYRDGREENWRVVEEWVGNDRKQGDVQ
jgi:hypothetical protein